MIPFFKQLQASALHFFYPASCLHCKILLPPQDALLCRDCSCQIELLPADERCPVCFHLSERGDALPCSECIHFPPAYTKRVAAFSYEGIPASLVKQLKYHHKPNLAQGMAAFLLIQCHALELPHPHFLVPVPQSRLRWMERGYNQSLLLCEELKKWTGSQICDPLRRKSGSPSQAALDLKQREALDDAQFSIRSAKQLRGKTVLLVDDVTTSGATLQRCAALLQTEHPSSVYAITFCLTEKQNA